MYFCIQIYKQIETAAAGTHPANPDQRAAVAITEETSRTMTHLATLKTNFHGNGSGSASDQAFRLLWEWLVTGQAKDGQRLSENDLAARLRISRTPLRDALHRMEDVGLLERQINRTLVVRPMSVDEMVELSTTRESLEGLVARRVAERHAGGEVSLAGLRTLNERMARLAAIGETELLLDGGIEFHAELKRLAGNRSAARMLDQLMLALERYRQLVQRETERASQIVEEHEEVLRALEAGDGAAAEHTMRSHIANARAVYRRILGDILPRMPSSSVPMPGAAD